MSDLPEPPPAEVPPVGDPPFETPPSELPPDAPPAPVTPPPELPEGGLPPAALRALAEAAERRKVVKMPGPKELGGRDGPEPVRYGDWEKKGLAIDF